MVCDFRSSDVAAGGEGAPLIPLYHAAIAAGLEKPLMLLNWGGVGNVTYLGAGGEIVAFDTGPANALIDDFARAAARASPSTKAAGSRRAGACATISSREFLAEPLFRARRRRNRSTATSSMPRFGAVEPLSDADGAATLSAFTVEATAAALAQVPEPPRRWIVCGGGRKNATLMSRLAARLNAPVEPIEAIGWDGDAIEAQGFGYLALRSLRGLPLSLPTTTGVSRAAHRRSIVAGAADSLLPRAGEGGAKRSATSLLVAGMRAGRRRGACGGAPHPSPLPQAGEGE